MNAESPPTRRSGPIATDRSGVEIPTDTRSVARQLTDRCVSVPLHQLQTLLQVMESAAELRDREITDAYGRGYLAGSLDPQLLQCTWETAWQVALDRLTAGLVNPPDLGPGLAERVEARRAADAAWVRDGGDYPKWAAA